MKNQKLTDELKQAFDTIREGADEICDGIFLAVEQASTVFDCAVYSNEDGICYEVTIYTLKDDVEHDCFNFSYRSSLPTDEEYEKTEYLFAQHEEVTAFISQHLAKALQEL